MLALRTFDQLTGFLDTSFDGRRPQVRAFFSMVDRRKALHRNIVAALPDEHPGISSIAIPAMSVIEQMAVHRAPLPTFAPRSTATAAFRTLWTEAADALDSA